MGKPPLKKATNKQNLRLRVTILLKLTLQYWKSFIRFAVTELLLLIMATIPDYGFSIYLILSVSHLPFSLEIV